MVLKKREIQVEQHSLAGVRGSEFEKKIYGVEEGRPYAYLLIGEGERVGEGEE